MNSAQLKFPVITFGKDALYFARNENDLTICNSKGFKNGFYKDLHIVDSGGDYFKVIEARKTGTVGGFFGYDIFLEQKIKVELIFDDHRDQIDIKNFKEKVLQFIKIDKSFWSSDGLLKSRYAFIENAQSIKDIIDRLSTEFYKEFR